MIDDRPRESTQAEPRAAGTDDHAADLAGNEPGVRADGGAVETARTTGTDADTVLAGRPPLRPGFLLGIAAFIGTYAVMYSLRASELARSILPLRLSATPETPQVVGWLVYRAHFVPIEYTIEGVVGRRRGVLEIGSAPAALERLAQALEPGTLLVVPLFMLFVCGFYAAIECDTTDPRAGAVAGASVVVGYFLLVVVAVAAISWTVSQSVFDVTVTVAIGPETVRAVLFAGLLYPTVGGALGGAAAGTVAE